MKYLSSAKIEISRILEFRLDFLLGRVRNIVVLAVLYALWFTLSDKTGVFAGYTTEELAAYVFGMHILRAAVFGGQSQRMAQDINNGTFSLHLIKPMNVFAFYYARELGERLVLVGASVLEVAVFAKLFAIAFIPMPPWQIWSVALAAVVLAHVLYILLGHIMNTLAFWSREAHGPRFLFDWFLEFASGAYFPLSVLPIPFFLVLLILPFAPLLYFPMTIFLGIADFAGTTSFIFVMFAVWIIIAAGLSSILWKKGLRRYSGEGI